MSVLPEKASAPSGLAPDERPARRPVARSKHSFPRSARILRRSDFLRIQQAGRRVHTPHFVILLAAAGQGSGQRLGVTAGRRVGGAVRRNRIKRLVREVFRCNRELFPADCDVVLVARPGADGLDYASVKNELTRAQAALGRIEKQLRTQPNHRDPSASGT
jgi:ribonuclease P protein component